MKIITTIPNFDKTKSYPNVVQVKLVPLYATKCPCYYGYRCDDPEFDYSKPLRYVEIAKDDDRDKLFDS
jgi:hypothetical protein